MGISAVAAVFLLVASLAGQRPAPETPAAALARAEAVWKSQGIQSYQFTIIRSCFCGPRNGETFRVVDGRTELPAKTSASKKGLAESYGTVESLFAGIRRAMNGGAYRLKVRYHSKLGYPTFVDLDPRRDVADDEVQYGVSGFKIR